MTYSYSTRSLGISLAAALLASASALAAQDAPIVQPGAPGQGPRTLSAEEATALAKTSYSPDDTAFMQNMIVHHQQAVDMAKLVKERTNNPDLVTIAGRIDASQADEIDFMRGWLTERGEKPMMTMAHHGDMAAHNAAMGMATPAQMTQLTAAQGTEFDRQFLTLMIRHHEGAIKMADVLLEQSGSAHDPVLYQFITDLENEQQTEIDRMNVLLAKLSTDPRATLAAGLTDAEQASSHMRLIASLPKPNGFFDPANPGQFQPEKPKDKKDETDKAAADQTTPPEREEGGDGESGTQFGERSSLLSFWNTDMAFAGDLLFAGNYHGFNIYRLGEGGVPSLVSSIVCPGGQGDISVAGDLLIMSVEQTRGRVDCGLQGVTEDISDERFRGLRIFDISDVTRPRQVGQVQTCRGSHTHSIVEQSAETILVYNSGTAGVRDEKELAGCIGEVPGDERTALFSIDVIEIPVADPSAAKIIARPRVFADPQSGQIAGLWRGGDHGDDTQDTRRTDQCHDITVFPTLKLAAGACSGNGIILDISDPRAPVRIDAVTDKGFAYWHSATFNNDGTKVVFTDEWGGGARPRCRTYDPREWGADAIYDIVDRKLEYRSQYKLPAPQGDKENCVAHNGSIIPVPGRDIFLQAWYQGGISVIDFTDSANPVEIAYFDRGPVNAEQLVLGGYWSAYWYQGRIYATEITRGLDVFALEPSEFLSAEEIAAAEAADQSGSFNPQTQFPVTWPEGVAKTEEVTMDHKGG